MKLLDTLLLSLSAGFFIIGVHQLITVGLPQAYWIFMLSTVLLIAYQIRKKNRKDQTSSQEGMPGSGKKKSKKPTN